MYKLILVDDEELTLNNISIAVDWEKNGFELVGKFLSAENAIDYMKENAVDAIISDIKMQWMNGLEFAEYIHKNYSNIAFVVLSGYDSFEYATAALRNKVIDYILKPVMLKDIERVLSECKEFLDKIGFNSLSEDSLVLQEFIVKYLRDKSEDIALLRKALNKQGFKNNVEEALVVSANVIFEDGIQQHLKKHYSIGIDSFNNWINNLFVEERGILLIPTGYYLDHIEYIIFCDCTDKSECKNQIETVRSHIQKNAADMLGLKVDLISKKISDNIAGVFDDVRHEFIAINVNIVYEQVSNGETERAIEAYREFEKKINYNREDVYKFYSSLASRIKTYGNYFLYNDTVTKYIVTDISQIKDHKLDVCDMIRAVSTENQKPDIYDFVSAAKKFIDENYEKNITLADVADYVKLSESWLSRQFKRKTGKNFVDYLNEVRISKAVIMLKSTNDSVNNIYEAVGYKSRNHFFVQLKKHMGCSPQEYRKNIKQN